MAAKDVVDAIYRMTMKALEAPNSPMLKTTYGIFRGVSTSDANLSIVGMGNPEIQTDWIRKLKHVTGMVNGDVVMMVSNANTPLTIVGVVVGNVTLATH